ncbi:Rho-binding antiterminator [Simiduia sp. 21SJ11W-1]|uniref:Rho-binding antiterminator n=1 Tax=Simiduia sp. 21SJ11W-1 TaxID=2909669 RepID=UPI00209F7CF6|nr:Rho-binding antiterminator [Simiduia sp. 21SJ11W-1]UTA47111.1 Rho-binding antiterminator [Simiduia sp. 21SJ11W-1]
MAISCEQHDYFEIVCMRQSRVRVALADGTQRVGQALDINTRRGSEYLLLAIGSGQEPVAVPLNDIQRLWAEGNAAAHNFFIDLTQAAACTKL